MRAWDFSAAADRTSKARGIRNVTAEEQEDRRNAKKIITEIRSDTETDTETGTFPSEGASLELFSSSRSSVEGSETLRTKRKGSHERVVEKGVEAEVEAK